MLKFRSKNVGKPKPEDPIWCAWVLRPISVPLIIGATRLGISANYISLSMTFLAIGSILLLALGNWQWAITAAILLNIVALGDCVDGGVARVTGKSGAFGEWLDAQLGYTVHAGLPLAMGYRAFLEQGNTIFPNSPEILLVSGAAAAVFSLYSRLLYQKYLNACYSSGNTSSDIPRKNFITRRIFVEVDLVGLMMPFLLVSVITYYNYIFVLFYLFIYFVFCAVSVSKLTLNCLKR